MKEFGVQLYSVRDTMNDEAGIRETFRRLREMGYTQVQTAGCEIPFADFGRIAAEECLQIVGTHEVFDSMYEDYGRWPCHPEPGARGLVRLLQEGQ